MIMWGVKLPEVENQDWLERAIQGSCLGVGGDVRMRSARGRPEAGGELRTRGLGS